MRVISDSKVFDEILMTVLSSHIGRKRFGSDIMSSFGLFLKIDFLSLALLRKNLMRQLETKQHSTSISLIFFIHLLDDR